MAKNHEEQYDVSDFIRPVYVNSEVVKKEGEYSVIVRTEGVKEFENKQTGEKYEKTILYVEINGHQCEFSCGKKTTRQLTEDFGTPDTREWVGNRLRHVIENPGKQNEWVHAYGIPVKDGGDSDE